MQLGFSFSMFVCLSVCFVFSSLVLCQLVTYLSSKTGTVISTTVQWLEECTSYSLFVIRTIHISLDIPNDSMALHL